MLTNISISILCMEGSGNMYLKDIYTMSGIEEILEISGSQHYWSIHVLFYLIFIFLFILISFNKLDQLQ